MSREGEVMEEDGRGKGRERTTAKVVLMWGYLPGASPQRLPLLHPVAVRMPAASAGDSWRDVSGGGCGFAMALSESGKMFTWGSTDEMGPSYLTSGKHEEIPEPFPLQTEAPIVKAAAGWSHCVAVTADGEVYTWGWKECVPIGKAAGEQYVGGAMEKDARHGVFLNDQVSPRSQVSKPSDSIISGHDNRSGEENTKRRRLSSAKQSSESSTSTEEAFSTLPCLVTLGAGVRIANVAAGGRHTLALSDLGQVWGWGYGGEGQLGLGSRVRTVSSPHPIPCIESAAYNKGRLQATTMGKRSPDGQAHKIIGNCVRSIACGGRHSAVITDAGALLTFGWGLYGQCGQGSTDDELSPTCVSSLLGIKVQGIASGLWHTVCTSAEGDVYAFGGNQFGQLGTDSDQAETLPKLLDAPCLEEKNAKIVSCGARHSVMVTDDGEAYCWGWNKYGQLGLGDAIDRSKPAKVPIETFCIKNVSCGWWHTLVLAESRM